LLAIAYFWGRFAQIDSLGDKDRRAHLVDHGLSIAPGDVLLAVAKHGGDDILLHTMFAGAGGGSMAEIVEAGIGVDLGCIQDALVFSQQVARYFRIAVLGRKNKAMFMPVEAPLEALGLLNSLVFAQHLD
jgi:hypothetical protein